MHCIISKSTVPFGTKIVKSKSSSDVTIMPMADALEEPVEEVLFQAEGSLTDPADPIMDSEDGDDDDSSSSSSSSVSSATSATSSDDDASRIAAEFEEAFGKYGEKQEEGGAVVEAPSSTTTTTSGSGSWGWVSGLLSTLRGWFTAMTSMWTVFG